MDASELIITSWGGPTALPVHFFTLHLETDAEHSRFVCDKLCVTTLLGFTQGLLYRFFGGLFWFLVRDYNIVPKKALHRRVWV